MDFLVIGKITSISTAKYGVKVVVKECRPAYKTKQGYSSPTKIFYWSCIATNALANYAKNNFHKGNIVKVTGEVTQSIADGENTSNLPYNTFLIQSMNLFNILFDLDIEKKQYDLNKKAVGDETPDTDIYKDFE